MPDVSVADHFDQSPPLTLIPPVPHSAIPVEHPVKMLPRPPNTLQRDPVQQTGALSLLAPSLGVNFDGIGNGVAGFTVNSAPPDTNGNVGIAHYVQTVNSDFAVYNKSGGLLYGPVALNTLWSGFGGLCQTDNDGDPIVLYDRAADRWVISQFAVTGADGGATPFLECVAVSQTGDPTGAYNRYSFSYNGFDDYPKMSVWPDAYYETFNMFNAAGTSFLGAKVCAYDRAAMTAGTSATQQCFDLGASFGGVLSAARDGVTAPPAGAPNYLLALGANANQLAFWKFHVDWTTANSTLTGPTTLATAAFGGMCPGVSREVCIPQAGTTQQLEALSDRLMFPLTYRNFGDHESLLANHTVQAGSSSGIRWYEIRNLATTPAIYQQSTYAPDSNYRWVGSVSMDKSGNIGLGYSVSGNVKPEIHFTGRLATDPLNQMTQGENSIVNGAGSQTGQNLARWGDYSMMSLDPSDDCTFWYTTEYIPSDGAFNWKTRIGSFSLCSGTPPGNDFSISSNPGSLTLGPNAGGTSTISTTVVSGSGTVNLTVTGTPAGATATLNPTAVAAGNSSTLSVNAGTAAAGTYTLTISGTEGAATHSTTVALTVTNPGGGGGGITNGGFETGTFSGWTTAGTTSVVSGGAHGGTYAAQVGGTSPTNGDSSISQTFTAPANATSLGFWYAVHCPDTLTYDWATATLKDNVSGTTTTILAPVCNNAGTYTQVTAPVTAGRSYTLSLISHDDNYAGDPTYTLYDDVSISVSTPPANDFSISASPSSLTLVQGNSGTSTISTAVTAGSAGAVNLTVSGTPSGATATLSPPSVTAGGSSTLTVGAGSAAAATYTLTVTGTEGAATHSTTVALTVTAPATNDFSISASPSSLTLVQGSSGTSTISTAVTAGSAGTVNLTVSGTPSGATATLSPPSVTAGGSSTLTITAGASTAAGAYTITVTGTEGSKTHATTIALTVTSTGGGGGGITNGGFETGTFSGWTTAGTTSVVSSGAHGGTFAARVGGTSPTNGDSSVSQTFTVPAAATSLHFWYAVHCPDTLTYDWATATLRDNAAGTTRTILARVCNNSGTYTQVSAAVTAGRSYTLTLISHDDNYPGDPTYTLYDDVTLN